MEDLGDNEVFARENLKHPHHAKQGVVASNNGTGPKSHTTKNVLQIDRENKQPLRRNSHRQYT